MSSPISSPLTRIHTKLCERLDAPEETSTEIIVDWLLDRYEELLREAMLGIVFADPVVPADYHRQPHWTGGAFCWRPSDTSAAIPRPGAAMPAAEAAPRRQPPAKPT